MFSRGAEAAEKSAPAKRGAPNPAILDKLHCRTDYRQTRCFDLHAYASVACSRYNANHRPMRHDLISNTLNEATTIHNITLHPATDLWTLEHGQDLNDNCLDAALALIADAHDDTVAITSHFSTQLRTRGWTQAKTLLPKYNPTDTLIIPVHTGGNTIARHWSLLIRKKILEDGRYHFFYYDSLNSKSRATTIRTILETSRLYSTSRGDRWHNIECCPQQGRTCGPVTALNAALALDSTDHGESRQLALRGIPARGKITHAWLKTCINSKSVAPLRWIEEESILCGMYQQQRDTTTAIQSSNFFRH